MTSANTRKILPARLTRKSEFRRIVRIGKKVRFGFLKITYQQVPGSSGPGRIGYVIPDRVVKGSVGQNRIRRLLREAVRHWWDEIIPGIDIILQVLGQPEKDHAGFVEAVLLKLLLDARLIKDDAVADARDRVDALSVEFGIDVWLNGLG